MSCSIYITAYTGKENPEFKKHFKAVKFCIENDLSYPKETTDFFDGTIEGSGNLDDYCQDSILEIIENGVEVDMELHEDPNDYQKKIIKISEIPKHVEEIIIKCVG